MACLVLYRDWKRWFEPLHTIFSFLNPLPTLTHTTILLSYCLAFLSLSQAWVKTQQKTFTKWMNNHLNKKSVDIQGSRRACVWLGGSKPTRPSPNHTIPLSLTRTHIHSVLFFFLFPLSLSLSGVTLSSRMPKLISIPVSS